MFLKLLKHLFFDWLYLLRNCPFRVISYLCLLIGGFAD